MFIDQSNCIHLYDLIELLPTLRLFSIGDHSLTRLVIPSNNWKSIQSFIMHSLPRLRYLEVGAFALSQVRGLSVHRLDCLEEIVLAEGCMNEIEVQYIASRLEEEGKD